MARFTQKFHRNGVWQLWRTTSNTSEVVCYIHAEVKEPNDKLVFEAWSEGYKLFTVNKRIDAGPRYAIWEAAKALGS